MDRYNLMSSVETSAPESTLNDTFDTPIGSITHHGSPLCPLVTDPRKYLCLHCLDSVDFTSFTLYVRHTDWKCPILSHFRHFLSRAGQISSGL